MSTLCICLFSFLNWGYFYPQRLERKVDVFAVVLFEKDKILHFTSGSCRQMVRKYDMVHVDKGSAKTKGGREALGGGGGGEGGAVAASPVMSCVSVSRCQEPRSGLPPGHCCRPKCCLRRFHPKKPPGTTSPPKASANMSSGGVENRGNCRGGGGVCVRCRLIFFFELYFCSDGEAAEEQQRNYSGTNK